MAFSVINKMKKRIKKRRKRASSHCIYVVEVVAIEIGICHSARVLDRHLIGIVQVTVWLLLRRCTGIPQRYFAIHSLIVVVVSFTVDIDWLAVISIVVWRRNVSGWNGLAQVQDTGRYWATQDMTKVGENTTVVVGVGVVRVVALIWKGLFDL